MINAKTLAAAIAAAATLSSQPQQLVNPAQLLPQPTETCLKNCQIDDTGLALLKHFEGYSPFPYKDAVGVMTIGFGHAIQRGESIPAPLLGSAAETLLKSDARVSAKAINQQISVRLTTTQADALISFTFNLGGGALAKSTLRRRVNAGQHGKVPPEFLKWNHAGGKVLPGLSARRRAEAALYQAGN